MSYQDQLISLAPQAQACRAAGDVDGYAAAIAAIDAVAAKWRAAEPHLFWAEGDPDYDARSAEWALARQGRYSS